MRDYERERLGVERREAERREMFRRQASERASLAAAQARRDALHSSTSSDLLPEYKSEPPPVVRATSAEELRERFRNVGLSDLSP